MIEGQPSASAHAGASAGSTARTPQNDGLDFSRLPRFSRSR